MYVTKDFCLWLLLFLIPASPASAQSYTVTDLGALGGTSSGAAAINDQGDVVGTAILSNGAQEAFLWTSSAGMRGLGSLGGASTAQGVNDSLEVAGWSQISSGAVHAFLWTPSGGMQDLGTLGGTTSTAYAISDSGEVVGGSALSGNASSHAFVWTPTGGMQDLGTLGGNNSGAGGINKNGQVVGASFLSDNVTLHAFLWTQAGGMQDLGTPACCASSGLNAINNRGAAAGGANVTQGNEAVAIWTQSGGWRSLGTPALDSSALAISNSYQVVGLSQGTKAQQGFLWTQAQGMERLTSLVSGWAIQIASGVNRFGQIAATGYQPSCKGCQPHALLLTPTAKASGQANTSAARR